MDHIETEPTPTLQSAPQRKAAIREFIAQHAPGEDADLLEDMLVTVCRLARDGCGRGELKILNTALKELRYAFRTFGPYRDIRKVSIFGSSRTAEHHAEYQQAVRFAAAIREHHWMVITGAGDGIMRAGHGGAGKEKSFGVAIRLPFEQSANDIIADDPKLINFKYFFTRKLMFMKEASAVALFPGGFGTQDEGFEALTLIQTGKAGIMPIVMVDAPGRTYWQQWKSYVEHELLTNRMIDPDDMNLFTTTDDAEAAVQEILKFYRRYHSSRFVNDDLVLRVTSPVGNDELQRLNDEFSDIVVAGRIEASTGPVAGENSELPEMSRLQFRFNRRSHGRLRQMINQINEAS